MKHNDTICALATPTGGAISIIRLSGNNAVSILGNIFSKDILSAKGYTLRHGHITDNGEEIDEVMVSVYRAPHSYTGEDSAEIACHASPYILNRVIGLLIKHGCRMAQPGEYTMRAYLNGKMDLSQAEAIADLIASKNKATHQMAMAQMKGQFSSQLARLRQQLLQLTSLIELELDFSDHEDLQFADRRQLLRLTDEIEEHIRTLAQSFEKGQALKEGIPVAIVGKTNVGKSTLLNRLLKDNRAIISDIHGTTRDTIEDTIDINGVTFRIIDTAGIRQTGNQIEQIGIQRTYQAIEKARIILWITDDTPTDDETEEIIRLTTGKKLIAVRNKTDLKTTTTQHPSPVTHHPTIAISAKKGTNIAQLENLIYATADVSPADTDEVIVSNARHYDALRRADESINAVRNALQQGISGDLLSEDLRQTLNILAEITGEAITTDEVLSNIFSHFCIGK